MMESAPLTHRPHALRVFAASVLYTLVATLALAALFLSARRLGGALTTPPEFVRALAIGATIAIASWLLRYAAEKISDPQSQRLILAITIITWMIVATLTLSRMSPLAILALWLPVIAGEAAWRVLPRDRAAEPGSRGAGEQGREMPPDVVQQLTRVRRNGVEIITALASIEFAPQEQTSALHLAFCPPLDRDPQVRVEAADSAVAVRATECRSYGVRIEGKRRDANAAASVRVRVEATVS
jgi:hypothetical protein